jgi:hypothetical protein
VPVALMPGLGWLAAACDAVVDGGLGVQLARFNPIGITVARATAPVYAGQRDPREAPAVRALLDSLTASDGSDAEHSDAGPAVRLAGARSWRALPALYRGNAVFVTASAAQGREQTASGARVVGPLGSGTSAAALRDELAPAAAGAPLTLPEIRPRLRDIFLDDATPARLAALLRAAELPGSLVGGRQVAVLAELADGAQAARLAASLLAQRLRPAEVIAACPPGAAAAVRDALAGLDRQGLRVVVSEAPSATAVAGRAAAPLERLRRLTRLASASWLAPWPAPGAADGGQGEDYLLDLACARECAQADAVGYGREEYEFSRWLAEPALVRASLLSPDGPAVEDWGSHGLRLFSITTSTRSDR